MLMQQLLRIERQKQKKNQNTSAKSENIQTFEPNKRVGSERERKGNDYRQDRPELGRGRDYRYDRPELAEGKNYRYDRPESGSNYDIENEGRSPLNIKESDLRKREEMDNRLQGQSDKFDRYRHENDRRQNFE